LAIGSHDSLLLALVELGFEGMNSFFVAYVPDYPHTSAIFYCLNSGILKIAIINEKNLRNMMETSLNENTNLTQI
jgi:hypothetical protein